MKGADISAATPAFPFRPVKPGEGERERRGVCQTA